ncbi:MAG: hypothetical protein ACR2JE_10920 [Acidobacteriaceae bacterium]
MQSADDFQAITLTFFPQGKGLLDRLLGALKPSALNRLTDEGLLIGGKLNVHRLSVE